MKPVLFADDPQFWFETLRTLGHAAYAGADIGEVVTTAQKIAAGDYEAGRRVAGYCRQDRRRGGAPAGCGPSHQRP